MDPSVRRSVRPSVRPSVRQSVRQLVRASVRAPVLALRFLVLAALKHKSHDSFEHSGHPWWPQGRMTSARIERHDLHNSSSQQSNSRSNSRRKFSQSVAIKTQSKLLASNSFHKGSHFLIQWERNWQDPGYPALYPGYPARFSTRLSPSFHLFPTFRGTVVVKNQTDVSRTHFATILFTAKPPNETDRQRTQTRTRHSVFQAGIRLEYISCGRALRTSRCVD